MMFSTPVTGFLRPVLLTNKDRECRRDKDGLERRRISKRLLDILGSFRDRRGYPDKERISACLFPSDR